MKHFRTQTLSGGFPWGYVLNVKTGEDRLLSSQQNCDEQVSRYISVKALPSVACFIGKRGHFKDLDLALQ